VLFGRDAERALIDRLLDAARESRSGALALRGEAGVGKTVLLEDARARAGDMHVLSARGVESESELPFAALHQLLRPALRHLDRLPAPQAAALQSALGLADGGGQERFLIYSGCLSLLSELAEERPVLCLVDDVQWFDRSSIDAGGGGMMLSSEPRPNRNWSGVMPSTVCWLAVTACTVVINPRW
jgi:predicted ATPase